MDKIIIVGAGLCGSMLAVRMAQRGYDVEVFEKRADMRIGAYEGGRSINLALSDRGIKALDTIGLNHVVQSLSLPMKGRMIHDVQGNINLFPYSGRAGEYINSISRGGLNIELLNLASDFNNIQLNFNEECLSIDFDSGKLKFRNTVSYESREVSGTIIFGTDGAGSAVRKSMMTLSASIRFDFSQSYLSHGYKELTIPAAADGSFRINPEALHIWPRGDHMLIALPNLDGSFTVTLFQDFNGKYGLDQLDQNLDTAHKYFETYYKDALDCMPEFELDFKTNPSSSLGTIKCFPWRVGGRSLLLGDAAHAIVPFYGQGMNASFEDVSVLDSMMDAGFDSWESLFSRFEAHRKLDADAIADLAVDNFYEMRDSSGDPLFQKKVLLEKRLENYFSESYFSKYSMVTFREDMGYREAMIKGRKQDEILLKLCEKIDDVQQVNLSEILAVLESEM